VFSWQEPHTLNARIAPLWAALGASLALSACEKSPFSDDPPYAGSRTSGEPAAREQGAPPGLDLDGGIALERSDPAAPAGDLRDDVARFTTLDACVAQHALLDPLVGDAIRSIGYDTILRDACRVLQAIKTKDSAPCEAITASSLTERCKSLVAIALHDPDRCPWDAPSQKQRGREASCLAASTRDARSCGAALASARPACEALATGDTSRCAKASGPDREQCTRDFNRLRTILADERDAHEAAPPSARLEIHGASGTSDPSVATYDLSSAVAGGAVLAAEALGGAGVELARDLESSLRLAMRSDRPRLAASVAVEAGAPTLTKLTLYVPKVPEIECPGPHCALTVTMPPVEPRRGAPITVGIEGTTETPGGTYRIKLTIASFVRDIVGRSTMYGGR
jgi:hypothetical protein